MLFPIKNDLKNPFRYWWELYVWVVLCLVTQKNQSYDFIKSNSLLFWPFSNPLVLSISSSIAGMGLFVFFLMITGFEFYLPFPNIIRASFDPDFWTFQSVGSIWESETENSPNKDLTKFCQTHSKLPRVW